MNMSNIKTFDQYLEEMYHQEEQFPDEFFDVIGDSKAAQMLVSLTKTVQTDSPDTTGWSVSFRHPRQRIKLFFCKDSLSKFLSLTY